MREGGGLSGAGGMWRLSPTSSRSSFCKITWGATCRVSAIIPDLLHTSSSCLYADLSLLLSFLYLFLPALESISLLFTSATVQNTMAPPTHFKLNTGAQIPAVGLGTWRSEPGEARRVVSYALRDGYRHIDAAL